MTTSIMPKLHREARRAALLERVTVWQPRPNWWERGGCVQQPTEWWYEGGPKSKGAQICDGCPVRLDCLADTIRVELELDNVESVQGHRCITAQARRQYITRQRAGVVT